jgi:Leucine-rich repeat (LRR) protein
MNSIELEKNWLENNVDLVLFDTKKDLDVLKKEIGPKKLEKDWMQEHEWIQKAIENYDWSGFLDLSNQSIFSDHLETHWSDIVKLKPSIKNLDLSNNRIDYIGFMSGLSELTNLNLSNNLIEKLESGPDWKKIFDGFKSLEILDLSNNKIFFFDDSFFSDDVKNSIKNLNLSNNSWDLYGDPIVLSEISLSSLKNLKILRAENNEITSENLVSWNKKKLKSLQWLYLSGNKINNFDFLENFPKLSSLDVTKNSFFNLNLVSSELSSSVILNSGSSFEWIQKAKINTLYLDSVIGDNRDKAIEMIPWWEEMEKAQEKGLEIIFGKSN